MRRLINSRNAAKIVIDSKGSCRSACPSNPLRIPAITVNFTGTTMLRIADIGFRYSNGKKNKNNRGL